MYSHVIVNIPALYDRLLTYRGEARPGGMVRVSVGNRTAAALVIACEPSCETTREDLKPLGEPLYGGYSWLDNDLLQLSKAMKEFYLCSWGSIIELLLPVPFSVTEVSGLKRPPRSCDISADHTLVRAAPTVLTAEQQHAISRVSAALGAEHKKPHLLYGVTGSGKTEVYLAAISETLARGQQALYLVPEISLTPQVIANVVARFGEKVGVLHSGLSRGERARTWKHIQSGETQVVVGARSAVFAPVKNLGLIVLDEEHETSYRHEGGVNFHTRVVAQLRARQHGALLLLGSATPSLEVYSSAKRGGTELISMTTRPQGSALPEVKIIDMREELRIGAKGLISSPLRQAIAERLEAGEQALLLFNRRGYSQLSLCEGCGDIAVCPHCDVSLRLHAGASLLKCHYCGYSERTRRTCKKCGGQSFRNRGAGTEKLEEEVVSLFPDFRVTRLDADTTSTKGSHQRLLTQFGKNDSQVLVGTRMIAKGLDFPKVTVVGVIDADSGLFYPDFRAVEESFNLLMQVAGRSGRGKLAGRVYIQSFNPEHYCLRLLTEHNYDAFYSVESKLRRKLCYPPFGGLLTIHFRSHDLLRVQQAVKSAAEIFAREKDLTILGPVAESPEKVKDVYRYQLGLKGSSRKLLQDTFRRIRPVLEEICSPLAHWYTIIE